MVVTSSSRELVRKLFGGREVSRLPIILNLGAYAARLNQLSYQQMTGDPTLLANSLQSAQRLFGCDGMVVLWDPTIEAEACGCQIVWMGDEPIIASRPLANGCQCEGLPDIGNVESRGRVAVALEAARRLSIVIGKEVALIGAVTGPITLAYNLRGEGFLKDLDERPDEAFQIVDFALQVIVRIGKKYLDAGMDVLLVADPLLGEVGSSHYPRIRSALRTLWNVVDFFDADSLLLTKPGAGTSLDDLLSLGATGLAVEGEVQPEMIAEQARRCNRCFAVSLSPFIVDGNLADLERIALACRGEKGATSRTFFACWQVPRVTPPENIHQVLRLLRDEG